MKFKKIVLGPIVGSVVGKKDADDQAGSATPAVPSAAQDVVAKTYQGSRALRKGIEEMARQGYSVIAQSAATPTTFGGKHGRVGYTKTTVTFQRTSATIDDVKICPDCAEEIKAAAHVCRFCGHRFANAEAT